jgi:mono/diheme cytochrome c family protein
MKRHLTSFTLLLLAWTIAFCERVVATEDSKSQPAERFVQRVAPLLKAKCLSCHGPDKQAGGLRLDSLQSALKGGDSGPAIVPGDAAKSLLVKAVRFDDPDLQMPPKDQLAAKEIQALTWWINDGAVWPRPVLVLFDDEEPFLAALTKGEAKSRFERRDTHRGSLAVAVSPREKFDEQIADWKLPIREKPGPAEFRYLRYAWKKTGGGGAMLEVAREGKWPPAKATPAPGGRYVAGPNETGMDAIVVDDAAPQDWTVVTIDLWKDLGDCEVTGLSLMASGSGETLFDAMLLGSSIADLDAWSPGRGDLAFKPAPKIEPVGTAFEDSRNPIRKLFRGERLDLWSLKPVVSTSVLETQRGDSAELSSKMIDRLIDKRLAEADITPAPEADRRTLIRRLAFDLTGLPPKPDEVATFLGDKSPDALETVVDRLLASAAYGERQARLWLDVVRYADTNGYERDEFRPRIWMYRDYVVRSFNSDKPFDQFIREQLAGDEIVNGLPQNSAEADALIATGYLRLGQWDSTASIFQEEDRLRAEMMADLTNTTASAFLGLTMSCCQCHDHKYDPLSQADHYRLRAFFAGVTPQDDLVVELPRQRQANEQHNSALGQRIEQLKAEQAKLDKEQEPGKTRAAELSKEISALEAQKRQPLSAMGATDAGSSAPVTRVLYQGVFRDPRDEVAPGFPSVLYPGPAEIHAPTESTTGRRLALANWITSSSNPWPARVIVNRVWQQHFGTGLVATPNDFGMTGARPTHPELLDYLAARFVRDGWSIKRLHRAIVMTRAYRRESAHEAVAAKIDPDNRLLWRQNVRRLDAETLRDSLLAVSGLLKKNDGGKPIWPEVPRELLHAQPAILEAIEGKDDGRRQGWYTDPVEATDVRSLYLVRKRCLPIPFLQAFDLPDTTVSCARRDTTVVAPQALMLLNSLTAVRYAEAFADRVWQACKLPAGESQETDESPRIVAAVFQLALARDPEPEERTLAQDLLLRHGDKHRVNASKSEAERLALIDLCRAMFNLNEFIYID